MAKGKRSFLPTKSDPKTVEWLWANDDFQERFPAVYELLARGMYEGQPRKGATVTLFCVDGRLKCCVSDRESGQGLWITLEAAGDCLEEIERAVAQEAAEWRPMKKGNGNPVF